MSSTASSANTGNSIPPQPLFHPNEDQSWQTHKQAFSDVSYGQPQAAIPGFLDSWNELDGLNATNLGNSDFANPSSLTSSPASSWPVSGPSTAQTPSSLSDTSFSPVISEPRFPPLARTDSALPGPQWRVGGVQKLDSSDREHVQAATAGCSRSMTTPAPVPPSRTPMSPQTGIGPSPHRLQQTNQQTNRPSSNQSMQALHNNHLSTQPCLQCGYYNPQAYSTPPIPFEHGASTPATALTPTPLSQTTPSPGFDLSGYGIDINNLPDPTIAQVNNNSARVVHVDERHRRNSSHDSHHGHICGSIPLQSQQQVTQPMLQQATRRESNAGQGQERVVLVYLQSANRAS